MLDNNSAKKLKEGRKEKLGNSILGLFVIGGFLAGFLALTASILTGLILYNLYFSSSIFILILVLEEESLKFLGLKLLLSGEKLLTCFNLFKAFLFGTGFGLFEFTLLYFKIGLKELTPFSIATILTVHILTSIFLILTIFFFKEKRFLWASTTFSITIAVHFIYNINIL